MELDDQLAALAAGELDDDTARALRARAAADPAVARRLARHERLEALLTDWQAPAMSDAAVERLDAVLDDALSDLGDEPLAERSAPTGPLGALEDPGEGGAAPSGGVVDLGAARERREARRGLPAWVPGATVAAALLAVVGTGIVGGGLFSGSDEATEDSMADAPMEESAESDDEGMSATGLSDSDEAASDDMAEESMDAEVAEEAAPVAPSFRTSVQVDEGDLLTLTESPTTATTDDADGGQDDAADDGDVDPEAIDSCVVEALERDTTAADERIVWRVASGTYADQEAVFVVIRTPADDGDRYDVLAYDPADCSLLARDDTVR